MPNNSVFGSWFRMLNYHELHPFQYILIPCFFYGIVATYFFKTISYESIREQMFLTIKIILITIFISCPFGGILWHFHDMQAGYFPEEWVNLMFSRGTSDGIHLGWLIILLSFPYNIFGSIICFYLTKSGYKLYNKILKENNNENILQTTN
jgi:hypothetical protein